MITTAHSTRDGNGDFAEHASRIANATSPARDSLGMALAIYATLIVVASLSGAFGTHNIDLGPRFAFWTALILWNAMKWHLWLSLSHRRLGWPAAIAVGAFVLNLMLPFETRIALGLAPALPMNEFLRIYLSAAAISLISGVACTVAFSYFGIAKGRVRQPSASLVSPPPVRGEPLALGVREAELWAIEAEDHYIRLLLADGRAPLLSGRFGDALAQVAHIDGCRIHRGRWVADAAVAGVERSGRSWRAVLPDGRRLAISASHVGGIRDRGWMSRRA